MSNEDTSNTVNLVNPSDINIERFTNNEALLEITANDLNIIGIYLLSIGKPENDVCLKILASNYDKLINRVKLRDGKLVSSVKTTKRLETLKSDIQEIILQLKESEYSQDEVIAKLQELLK